MLSANWPVSILLCQLMIEAISNPTVFPIADLTRHHTISPLPLFWPQVAYTSRSLANWYSS